MNRRGRSKRRISLILVLCMVVALLPVRSEAVDRSSRSRNENTSSKPGEWPDPFDIIDPGEIIDPVVTPDPVATPTPTKKPAKKTKAAKVRKRMLKLKKKYPEGTPWTDANVYVWDRILSPTIIMNACGCVAFACILSDAGFGKNKKAKQVDNPRASSIRVGDILRVDDNTHSVIVLKVGAHDFTIAEGNYNRSIHWGRKLPKSTPIDYKWTRWKKKN